jgi:hypothetical protein
MGVGSSSTRPEGRCILFGKDLDPSLLEQSGCYAITRHQRAGEAALVNLAHPTGWAITLEDSLPDAKALGQFQRGPGPGHKLSRHISTIAGQYASPSFQHSLAVQASIGRFDLCWKAWRGQASGHFGADGNHTPLGGQAA